MLTFETAPFFCVYPVYYVFNHIPIYAFANGISVISPTNCAILIIYMNIKCESPTCFDTRENSITVIKQIVDEMLLFARFFSLS